MWEILELHEAKWAIPPKLTHSPFDFKLTQSVSDYYLMIRNYFYMDSWNEMINHTKGYIECVYIQRATNGYDDRDGKITWYGLALTLDQVTKFCDQIRSYWLLESCSLHDQLIWLVADEEDSKLFLSSENIGKLIKYGVDIVMVPDVNFEKSTVLVMQEISHWSWRNSNPLG